MFRKRPYYGWLALAVLLWGIAAYFNRAHQAMMQPAAMARAYQQQQYRRDSDLHLFLKDTALISRVFNGRISASDVPSLRHHSFYIFAYEGGHLLYWNDDDLLALPAPATDTAGTLGFTYNQYGIRRTFGYPPHAGRRRALVIWFTAKVSYSYENQYLQSNFNHLQYIPKETEVLDKPAPGAFPITSRSGHTWLYLRFPDVSGAPLLPDNATIIAALLAALASLLWLQLLVLDITRRRSRTMGFFLTLALVVLLRALPLWLPLPFGTGELPLMSPAVYAYSSLLPSLGDLLLTEIALLWLIVFVITETNYKSYWASLRARAQRYGVAALVLCGFALAISAYYTVLQSLVLDSQLSFDVSHFHTIDGYTVCGLTAIGLGIILLELSVRFLYLQLVQLLHRRGLRLLLAVLITLLLLWLLHRNEPVIFALAAWTIGYFFLLERRYDAVPSMLSLNMIFLSLFSCAAVALVIQQLEQRRDLEKDRIGYARHLLARQDPLMELNFKNMAPRLARDEALLNYVDHPTEEGKAALQRRLDLLYFHDVADRYVPEYFISKGASAVLQGNDSVSIPLLDERFDQGMPTEDEQLIFTEGADNNNYLARIPLTGHQGARLYISLSLKKQINETVYPELLEPATTNQRDKDARYNYALYFRGRRITQTSNYQFPAVIDTAAPPGYKKIRRGFYELRYQETPENVAIIAGSTGTLLSAAILLSYLFGVHLMLSLMALLFRRFFRTMMRDDVAAQPVSLQQRFHFGTLIILLISFFILGVATVIYFSDHYSDSTRERRYSTTEGVARTVQQYLGSQGALASRAAFDSAARTSEFRYMLYNLAHGQNIDANVFGYDGRLIAGSQEDLYERGLLAPVMWYKARHDLLSGAGISDEPTAICYFPFLTCYMPLRNDEGSVLGFISVPFFSSEKELNDQISNIVVALINLYALLFFVSSFLAWFISIRLTHAFSALIDRFGKLSLQKNELLEWPYQDEIGRLVAEYNKMALKVEESASRLAQNERETAWREMARQVAHEIKNPLTPMKLNIQYLQQALQSGRPDVEALATRVSASIIEQIDNLTYIASEFSNFARMPDAKAEVFALDELVENALPLYQGETQAEITATLPDEPLLILSDHSQLLRVFTNLMQNAVQAIPEDRAGSIQVTVRREGHEAVLTVSDNGSGIDEETAAKLFKPYFTTKTSGTGLGLAMSRKIIELWKGTIWFDSVPGEGTTFFIRLPLA